VFDVLQQHDAGNRQWCKWEATAVPQAATCPARDVPLRAAATTAKPQRIAKQPKSLAERWLGADQHSGCRDFSGHIILSDSMLRAAPYLAAADTL
jgi:hypothetical protein